MRAKGRFPRFSELDAERCNVEHHVHTRWTDGKASVTDVLRTARQRGLRSIAFTEHVRREGSDWFSDFAGEVRAAGRAEGGIEVLVGCEAKALDTDGSLDVSDAILSECDIVLGSVHRWTGAGGALVNFADVPEAEFAEIEAAHALGLLRNPSIDVLAHPGGMYQRRHKRFPNDVMRSIVQAATEEGKAVEISSSYLCDVPEFLRICRELDPFVSIGSDAHTLEDIGRCRDVLVAALEHDA